MKNVLDGTITCPIKPNQVDASKHFYDAFYNHETEVSAHYLVLLAQEKGSWAPFTYEEIDKLYQEHGHNDGFTFNNLLTDGWIVQSGDLYYYTLQFVTRAYGSSPKI